jgi:hypothetical protein
VKGNHRKAFLSLLPFGASLFALVFSIIVVGDASATVLLDPSISSLSDAPSVERYLAVHLLAGLALFAAGVASIVGLEKRSERLLFAGQLTGSAVCAGIVVLESLSLWAMPYLE